VSQLRDAKWTAGVRSEVVGELAGHSASVTVSAAPSMNSSGRSMRLVIGEHGSLCPLQLGECAGRHEFGAASVGNVGQRSASFAARRFQTAGRARARQQGLSITAAAGGSPVASRDSAGTTSAPKPWPTRTCGTSRRRRTRA